ncbi:MAG TPA: AAA family ATPase, partial [Candidatus Baltobacteraceae bacterium]
MANRLMRARLNERLGRAARFPVTLIVAPAGFGKTVALRDFLKTNRSDAVRYDVRREHSSLLALVRGLADALTALAPSAAATYPSLGVRIMAADDPVRECSDWLAEHLKRTVGTIVVDDVHHAAVDPLAVALLVDLIERTHERITWILATRSDAGLPVASWVGYGIMDVPVGESDLRFTDEEALATAEDSGARGGVREILALRELTGGWPIALAIALRTRTQAADLRTATAGTREMIYRYLAEQVFARLSPEERRLLIDTCVFEAFDAGVAEALGAPPELFADLRRDVAFMSATATNEYRYHDLFRDFLESQLHGSSEREWRRVVRNAAAVLEARGDAGGALRMLVKIEDAPAIVRILERAGFDLIERGESETLTAALEAVPQELHEKNAAILGIAAMLDAARGHFDVCEGRFLSAIATADAPTLRGTLIYRYALELVRNQRDCSDILGPLAADQTLPKDLRVPVLATLATAYAAAGRLEEAFSTIDAALKALGDVTRGDVRARVYQQAAYVFQFDVGYERAKKYAQLAVEQALAHNLFEVAARAYSVLYNIVYEETDDPIAVLAVLDKLGEAARKSASNQVRVFGLIAAYEIEAERGD